MLTDLAEQQPSFETSRTGEFCFALEWSWPALQSFGFWQVEWNATLEWSIFAVIQSRRGPGQSSLLNDIVMLLLLDVSWKGNEDISITYIETQWY